MIILLSPLTKAAVLLAGERWVAEPARENGRRVVLPVFLVFRHAGRFDSEWRMVRRSRIYSVALMRYEALRASYQYGGVALVAILGSYSESDYTPEVWKFEIKSVRKQRRTLARKQVANDLF